MAVKGAAIRHCVALFGGSFDPVHNGHVALIDYCVDLLKPDALRIIPAGNPWQKGALHASGTHRAAMVRLAFSGQAIPVYVDEQEIRRDSATYTIDTVQAIRSELGSDASIIFLIGADQLLHLDSWRQWRQLFEYAHLCAVARPGFTMAIPQVPAEVVGEFARRAGTPAQIRNSTHGLTYLAHDLAEQISSTEVRAALQRGDRPVSLVPLVPRGMLDYIEQHHLYQS